MSQKFLLPVSHSQARRFKAQGLVETPQGFTKPEAPADPAPLPKPQDLSAAADLAALVLVSIEDDVEVDHLSPTELAVRFPDDRGRTFTITITEDTDHGNV